MIGIIGILLLITGICYSCAYKSEEPAAELFTSLTGSENSANEDNQASGKEGTSDNSSSGQNASSQESSPVNICVHLCGAVRLPGVYQVPENSRVIDLIEQAGGLAKEAAGDYINQAQQVTDGQRIYIPTKDEVKEMSVTTDMLTDGGSQVASASSKKLININLADAKELMELPGVGEAKAASIIEYRTANGSFQTIEGIMKIPGIKEGLFNKISSYITVK